MRLSPGDVVTRARETFARGRHRWDALDVLVRAYQHFTGINASQLGGSITYFGFLSFFPLIAVAFSVVGFIVVAVPTAPHLVNEALANALPGLVGGDDGIDAESIASARTGVGIIGFVTLLYSASGIASNIRSALDRVFVVPKGEQRNFVFGKLSDLLTIAVSGVILVISVAASSAVSGGVKDTLLTALGLAKDSPLGVVFVILGLAIGVASSTLMLYLIYRVLPSHHLRRRSLLTGAFIAAIGLEIIKVAATLIISGVTNNKLYGTFGVIIALLVWLNYFARLLLFGASIAVADNGLTETELVRSEAFATRAAALADRPLGLRRVTDRLRARAALSTVVLRRSRDDEA
jgi:membrane protein